MLPEVHVTNQQISEPFIKTVNQILPNIPWAILVLLIGILLIRLIARLVHFGLSFTRLPKGLIDVITTIVDVALWVFLIIAILQFLGLNNIALAVTGSFAFVVLGLSQGGASAIADVLSGLNLARDRDFNVGDHVKAGDKQTEGIIEAIELRRTRVRDKDGHLHILPNANIDKNEWTLLDSKKDLVRSVVRFNIKERIKRRRVKS